MKKSQITSAIGTTLAIAVCGYIWYACYKVISNSRISYPSGYKPKEYGDFYTR